MKAAIDILLVESEPGFVAKIRRSLRRAGLSFRIKRIKSEDALQHELERHRPDVIISDFEVSRSFRFAALAVLKETRLDVPFVFVTVSREKGL